MCSERNVALPDSFENVLENDVTEVIKGSRPAHVNLRGGAVVGNVVLEAAVE